MQTIVFFTILLVRQSDASWVTGDTAITRDLHGSNVGICNNTQGGRWYIADDQGFVCSREHLDYSRGCCKHDEAVKHSCDTCTLDDNCCSNYEHCVSCCMKPEHQPEQRMLEEFRGLGKPETGHWTTAFDFCQNICLTTSRSTAHENSFILDRRFCFSPMGRPLEDVPAAPDLSEGIELLVGAPGKSCDETCRQQRNSCVEEEFAAINDCNTLRSFFMCEAGCGSGFPGDNFFPGYVTSRAAKMERPAYCSWLVTEPGFTIPQFNCSISKPHAQRLCPCKHVETVAEDEEAADIAETPDQAVKPKREKAVSEAYLGEERGRLI